MSQQISNEIMFRGYAKQEDDHWTAICIDLNVVGQGDDPDEAIGACIALAMEYIDYVCQKYRDDLAKYLFRPAPVEFIDKYNEIIGSLIAMGKENATSSELRRSYRNFSFNSSLTN